MSWKDEFPIFENNPQLVFLDSAASSQKPRQVIEAMKYFMEYCYANIHRGVYKLSEEATEAYEEARKKIAAFIGAKPEEIIFVKNATEGINLLSYALKAQAYAVSRLEHHSNLLPWMKAAKRNQAAFSWVEITKEGFFLDLPEAEIYGLTAASNVLGTVNDIKFWTKKIHHQGGVSIIDGTQAVPHMPINVKELNADFLVFSGHKMLGPTGIGVVYGKKELLESLEPPFVGGGMVEWVYEDYFTPSQLPEKFEAGTPPIIEAIGLKAAVEYLEKIGMNRVLEHERKLMKILWEETAELPIQRYGPEPERRMGVFAFNVPGKHPHDIAKLLWKKYKIAVRSGHHCAIPLHRLLGIRGSVRASFYIYNDEQDVDKFIQALKELS